MADQGSQEFSGAALTSTAFGSLGQGTPFPDDPGHFGNDFPAGLPKSQVVQYVGESLALIWPQVTGLIAATIVLFAVAYMLFQRQEIRA